MRKSPSSRSLILGVAAVAAVAAGHGAATADATTYQYDALGRLVKVIYENGATTTYAYDANNNRTQVTTELAPPSPPPPPPPPSEPMEWIVPLLL